MSDARCGERGASQILPHRRALSVGRSVVIRGAGRDGRPQAEYRKKQASIMRIGGDQSPREPVADSDIEMTMVDPSVTCGRTPKL